MSTFTTILTATLGVTLLLFLAPLFGIVFGAFGGWVVGLFYLDTMRLLAGGLGFPDAEPWQLGAMLGFVGGFFKSTQTNSKSAR